MRRILCAILALTVVMSISACGKKTEETLSSPPSPSQTSSSSEPVPESSESESSESESSESESSKSESSKSESSKPESSKSESSKSESSKPDAPPEAEPKRETIPVIRIKTERGKPIPDDKESIRCTVGLENEGEDYLLENLAANVRVRGNGSLSVAQRFGKFPYKLKFDKKVNPFGIDTDANRDWVLIPNRGDRTMLRNFAAKRLGEMLSGIPVSPCFLAVHVYLNGEYEGVYELTEQIEVAKGRVPVDDSLAGYENGFLIELDRYARAPDEGDVTFGVGENLYTVKSEVKNEKQLAFITEYITLVEEAVYSGDKNKFSELVDINSVVDMYLLQEFSKNIDAGFSSFYMYRNAGGKLCFAPPWDFDLAFGNDRRLDKGSSEGLYIATGRKNFSQNHRWYIELYKTDWFKALIKKRWKEITNREIKAVISEVESMAERLSLDMEQNFRRWPEFDIRLHQEPEHTLTFTTYKEHTDYLADWMRGRKEFLDGIFLVDKGQ